MSTPDSPDTPEASRFVRLRVELVLDVTDAGTLAGAALERIGRDEHMTADERTHAEASVREDDAEAVAYLVDPFDLVGEVPGVELAQASWSSEAIDYDPDAEDWDDEDEDEEDEEDEGEEDDEGDEGEGGDHPVEREA
ncbi:hypothetical protein [Streptomyces sp. NBC_01304]|uniref:hypothetical protein n=1 Tax=Streptomyces sp. NBC_01304 TaxID=2903818 RepID=UPI002E10AC71|nr:hypothetical protein OG430_19515 [Streptomyces sp. NBC_01304]